MLAIYFIDNEYFFGLKIKEEIFCQYVDSMTGA